jgi:hypothetical protein
MLLSYSNCIELLLEVNVHHTRNAIAMWLGEPSTATLCSLSEQCANGTISVQHCCSVHSNASSNSILVSLTLYYYFDILLLTTVRRQCWRRRQYRGAAAMGVRGRIA